MREKKGETELSVMLRLCGECANHPKTEAC